MNTEEDWNIIQEELNDLEDLGNGNGMEFKITRCKVMDLGTNENDLLWTVGSSVGNDREKKTPSCNSQSQNYYEQPVHLEHRKGKYNLKIYWGKHF